MNRRRDDLRDRSEQGQQILGTVLLILLLFGGAIADWLA